MSGSVKMNCEVSYKKKIGKLILFEKSLSFNSPSSSELNLDILLDKISIVQKSENPKKKTSLIKITTKSRDGEVAYIFSFNHDKSHFRDILYDFLLKGDKETVENNINIQETFFQMNTNKKNLIYLLMTNKYFQLLYEEISEILTKEEFLDFIRIKYKNKIDMTYPKISLNRSDELILSQNNCDGKNYSTFDNRLLNKFRNYDDDLNILYENNKNSENRKKFWEEFIENQKKKETELVGEYNPIFYSQDQINRINDIKKKINIPDKANKIANEVSLKMSLYKKQYLKNNYFGTSLNVKELNIEVEKLNDFTNGRIEAMKENTNKLIISLNDYSSRKLKYMEPMSKNFENKINSSDKKEDRIIIDNMEKINQQKVPNEEKLNDMLKEYELSKNNNSLNKQKLDINKQIFFELNERIKDNIKNCTFTFITNNVDQDAFDTLKLEYSLLRDLKDLSCFINKKLSPEVKIKKQYALLNEYSKSYKRINEFIETYKGSNVESNRNANIKELKEKITDSFGSLLGYYDQLRREIN